MVCFSGFIIIIPDGVSCTRYYDENNNNKICIRCTYEETLEKGHGPECVRGRYLISDQTDSAIFDVDIGIG